MLRLTRILAAFALFLAASCLQAETDEIGGADIIDRVDRVMRVSADTAETWHAGVANLDTWPARLERALLQTLGPPAMQDTQAGMQALERLLEERPQGVHVDQEARETLSVVIELIRRAVSAQRESDRAASALEHEREAHRRTLDKLEALREIDHQLDEREDNGGE
ncbi:hypothetical protein [Wenzhouxiangella sediminis]|uniref:DnrO protein n=1 Tax=Wenzhouxiangella sediminis TaxID=1792836 RepID=A0A3E1K7M0_9GAMM|nr:hypothetical protein [Wenzhouxiangella sediminis]RFF29677.1 hypothetical protein DZC52_11335 [Wenzhouxiangella sediminis]